MVIKVGSQMNPIKNVNIGDRVDCGGYLGVVKYVGLIEGYHNTWIGIDWDDHNRGKHNGTVQGIRYFVASAEQSGSFVRPDKVQLGRSIVSAITSRYGQSEEATAKLTDEELSSIQKSLNAPFLQLVGFEKVSHRQSKYEKLEIINLRQQNVSCLEGPELRSICPNLIELDVSKNLFTNWTVVFDVCEQLDHLQWLNVSENFMTFPSTYENYEFPNVKTLICSIMRLNWLTVTQLGRVYPNLEELRVPLNNIETLTTPDELFLKLKLLDLEGNPIKNWEEVLKLTTITSLQQLNVEDAGLTRIYFDDSHLFRNLKRLVISQNQIEDWDSISELNKLPSLNDLRFLRNPVLETESYATCIQLIIAKIGNLQTLNGAPLRLDERKGAEYDYIKKYGLDWLETKNNPTKQAQFVKKHRRYEELIQLHGPPEEAELMIQSKLIKVSLIDIKFVYNGRTLSKKLPPTILIQKLIMLAQRLFNLSDRPTLTYISGEHSEIEIELSDEGKELGFYSMLDGDKIIVST
ncbi:hypothetical protein FQA39_LY05557 [Lamprigera yunnana]|nr:hypothetical protein FQA39_LY05557 [Lamprigera yunnana]